jgi:hypothetical protein
MKFISNRYAVVLGTAWMSNSYVQVPWYAGRERLQYTISYNRGIHVASSFLPYRLKKGDMVLIERGPSNIAITARLYGDSSEGTPYQGNGGIMQPHDSPGGTIITAPGTMPAFYAGWLEFDTGPGLDGGAIHP